MTPFARPRDQKRSRLPSRDYLSDLPMALHLRQNLGSMHFRVFQHNRPKADTLRRPDRQRRPVGHNYQEHPHGEQPRTGHLAAWSLDFDGQVLAHTDRRSTRDMPKTGNRHLPPPLSLLLTRIPEPPAPGSWTIASHYARWIRATERPKTGQCAYPLLSDQLPL